jgi:GNAT superfamily N-acetyltransferase
MTDSSPIDGPFDPKTVADDFISSYNEFINRMQAESLPDEPPDPVEHTGRVLRNINPVVEVKSWVVWSPGGRDIEAEGHLALLLTEENRHLAEMVLNVLPERRRNGIASALLARLVEAAEDQGRTTFMARTQSTVPAGEAFVRRIGGTPGMEESSQQLKLDSVDRDLLHRWQERAQERASDFELTLWKDGYPEDELENVAAMWEASNLMPRGDLDVEDMHFTPDMVRDMDRAITRRGFERWTMVVRRRGDREIAGWTEVFWTPAKPDLLEQSGTAVFERYQNLGLGRWLKAAMLEEVLRERPQVARVQTGNATSNAPMLAINRELGFEPYISRMHWQIQCAQAREYLHRRAALHPSPVTT